jgi:hypothetical protein
MAMKPSLQIINLVLNPELLKAEGFSTIADF